MVVFQVFVWDVVEIGQGIDLTTLVIMLSLSHKGALDAIVQKSSARTP